MICFYYIIRQRLLENKALDLSSSMDIARKLSESYTRYQIPTVNAIAETENETTPPCTCYYCVEDYKKCCFFVPILAMTANGSQRKMLRVINMGGMVISLRCAGNAITYVCSYDACFYLVYHCFSFFRTAETSYGIYIS